MQSQMKETVGCYWVPLGDEDEIEKQSILIADIGANTVIVPYHKLDIVPLAYLQERHIQLLADLSVFVGESLREAYPDSVPIDAEGVPYDRDGWYVPVCPNHPQVRAQQLETVRALLEQHGAGIAGLWLDFIRFPVRWEGANPDLRPLCFCTNCLNHFLQADREDYSPAERRTHAETILQHRYNEWVDWKCSRIHQFIRDVRHLIAQQQDEILLGMFSLPWRRTDWDGAIRHTAGQDLGRFAEYIDIFSPMVYHQLCRQPVTWISEVIRDVSDWTQKPVLPVIQSMDRPESMQPEDLDAALTHAMASPGMGAMVFTLAPLLASEEKAGVVRRSFRG